MTTALTFARKALAGALIVLGSLPLGILALFAGLALAGAAVIGIIFLAVILLGIGLGWPEKLRVEPEDDYQGADHAYPENTPYGSLNGYEDSERWLVQRRAL